MHDTGTATPTIGDLEVDVPALADAIVNQLRRAEQIEIKSEFHRRASGMMVQFVAIFVLGGVMAGFILGVLVHWLVTR